MGVNGDRPRSRGHRKREKTRRQLIAAGLRVLAAKGDGLTISDVTAEADVSNGTFYNYFVDRDELLAVLAEHVALSLAAESAREPIADPAQRFAMATGRLILRAVEDPTWARVMLRLAGRPGAGSMLDRHLREDLAEGLARGRFDTGPDDATLDQVAGLILMTIRRIVEGGAELDAPARAIARGLRALGISAEEAEPLAADAVEALGSPTRPGRLA